MATIQFKLTVIVTVIVIIIVGVSTALCEAWGPFPVP